MSNPTGTALDAPDCSLPNSCDDFTLHVDTPAGYSTDHQLKITVSWPTPGEDYDVYLLDASTGNSVSSAATSSNPEIILVAPDAGDYTVRVVPFAIVPGSSYNAEATLINKPADPPPSTQTPPRLKSYGAPESLPRSHDAGEPSIGNNWKTGASFYQAYKATYKVLFDTAKPANATWSDVTANAQKGCPQGNITSLDPILYTDHKTGLTLESQLTLQDSLTCITQDDGQTWSPSEGGPPVSGVDHQTIGGGAYAPNDILPHQYPRIVYYCSQDIATAICAVSRDGGVTFPQETPTYDLTQCGGLHGHIKVANDGTAYLPNKGCGANQAVIVSQDNGLSWTARPVPGSTPGDSDPSVGIGSGGAVYFGYVGADAKPRIAVSHDKGETWQYDQGVGSEFGSAGIQNAVFPAVVAGNDNRAAFAFLGTTTPGDYQDADNFHGVWHLYVAYTYDGGQSWATRKVQPNDPVQRGSICTGGTTCGNNRNLLDFMDVTIDKQGRVQVGYADGCTGECVTTDKFPNNDDGGPYHDAYARIARQSSGKPLFAR